jgi:hypothetical protein
MDGTYNSCKRETFTNLEVRDLTLNFELCSYNLGMDRGKRSQGRRTGQNRTGSSLQVVCRQVGWQQAQKLGMLA